MLRPDLTDAKLFLDLLDGRPGARWTFQSFDDSTARREARAAAAKAAREVARAAGQSKLAADKAAAEAGRDPYAHIFHGALLDHWDELVALNDRGAGIFVTINETDGKGRKAKNIVRVRAIFADLDGQPLDEARAKLETIGLVPHVVVQSSPERWHLYMLVSGDFPVSQFTATQKRLIKLLGSDASVHDLPRVMRLPGTLHRKGEGFATQVLP